MKKLTGGATVLRLFILCIPLLMAIGSTCQAEVPVIQLTRQQAIAMALRNNIDLRVQALDSSLAKTDVQAGKAIYNPYLSSTLNYSRTSVAGETYGTETTSGYLGLSQQLSSGGTVTASTQTGPTSAISDPLYDYTDWSSSVGITIYQPLLRNAGKEATELGISQSRYAYAGSLESFRGEVIDTVYSVMTEYNRLYVLRQLLDSREAAVHSALQLLEEIKTQPGAGDNPAVEVSNTQYTLSQRQTDLIEAERQVSSQEAALRYLIGMEGNIHIIPQDPPSREEPLETEEQAMALVLEQHPDLKELRIQLESNQLRERVSKRNLWPELALTASGGYRGYAQNGSLGDTLSQISSGKGEYWSAGISVNFPLGNDLAESSHRQDQLRSEQLRNRIIAAEWKARDTIQDDNRSLLSARLQMRATAKSKQLAERRVTQYQKNRRRGAASVKDLLDAENDLIYARNLELNAVESFARLVARLWKDIGVLLEHQNVHIDTSQPEQVTSGDHRSNVPGTQSSGLKIESPVTLDLSTAEDSSKSTTSKTPSIQRQPVNVERSTQVTVTDRLPVESSFTLAIGELLSSQLVSVKKKIEQAGLVPVIIDGPMQKREVFRLLIGSYRSMSNARKALNPLKNTHSGGFILKSGNDSYDAFAGSFFSLAAAKTEQNRLADRIAKLRIRQLFVDLPTYQLTTGSFSTRKAAEDGARRLLQQGLQSRILENRI